MDYKINLSALHSLIEANSNDKEMLDIIFNCLNDFEEYHRRIFEMETKLVVYSDKTMSREDYIDTRENLDKARTVSHNAVIMDVKMLNRLAEKNNIPLIYEGSVSEEKPYRRELANAVLEYVESIIKNRP